MFKNLFGNNESTSKTGFFKIDNDKLIGINQVPGNGSINSCIESLGFLTNHVHIINTFSSDKIECLGFKSLSKQLVFVLAKGREAKLSYTDVLKEVKNINWRFEYSSLNIENILEDGINFENFSFEFLESVIDLNEEGNNIYKSDQLGMYLEFENGILKSFTSSGWENSATKWLNNLNPLMVKKMKDEAKLFHNNDIEIMEEVNKQAEALLGIPDAIRNAFIPLHKKNNGNISFYNLLITHYSNQCNIADFLFMNKGRCREISDNIVEVGNFIYSFNEYGILENSVRK